VADLHRSGLGDRRLSEIWKFFLRRGAGAAVETELPEPATTT
jgi:hypothetical protein